MRLFQHFAIGDGTVVFKYAQQIKSTLGVLLLVSPNQSTAYTEYKTTMGSERIENEVAYYSVKFFISVGRTCSDWGAGCHASPRGTVPVHAGPLGRDRAASVHSAVNKNSMC